MSQGASKLRNLVDLAKEPSSDRRRELLREVTDLFIDASDSYNERERDHFNAIMMNVARAMEQKVRRDLAQRMALEPNAPRGIITMLANDDIEVAGPILQNSTVFEDVDLLEVIRRQGQGHLRAISARATVSARVTDALVAKGDDTVLETLVRNEGATITRVSMERIVARAEDNKALHAPLVERPDLPPELLNEMFWFVSSNLRQHIVEKTSAIDAEVVDRMIAESQEAVVAELDAANSTVSEAERFIINKKRLGQLDEALLVELLTNRQYREFIFGLAHFVDVDIRTAQRIFYDPGCEALAIACKSRNISAENFGILLAHTKQQGGSKGMDTVELLELYNQLTVDSAQCTMRFWRVREQAQGQAAKPVALSA